MIYTIILIITLIGCAVFVGTYIYKLGKSQAILEEEIKNQRAAIKGAIDVQKDVEANRNMSRDELNKRMSKFTRSE